MILRYYICFDDVKHSTLDIIEVFEWQKHDYDLVIVDGYEYYEEAYEMVEALNLIMKTEIKCPEPPNWQQFLNKRRKNG